MKKLINRMGKPPWRTLLLCGGITLLGYIGYTAWEPGAPVQRGRFDRGTNGIWIQHGWLGADSWFELYGKDDQKAYFRNRKEIINLKKLFDFHGIAYVYPHLCPAETDGSIPAVDQEQTELFLEIFKGMKVLPWVGGVLDNHVFLENETWVNTFVASVRDLLERYPEFAGIHINVEPCPSGNRGFIRLLKNLKQTLPEGSILSVAAYPPPSRLHPFPEVHWEKEYFREVCSIADQVAVMMYDTSIRFEKVYTNLMYEWTREIIGWAGDCNVLLGVPAYDDEGVGYHYPEVENLQNALSGISKGLSGPCPCLPDNYLGIALYCEWEMDDKEWLYLKTNWGR